MKRLALALLVTRISYTLKGARSVQEPPGATQLPWGTELVQR